MITLVRIAALALLAAWLAVTDLHTITSSRELVVGVLVCGSVTWSVGTWKAAAARRSAFAVVVGLYAAWMLHDDGRWCDSFRALHVGSTAAEAVLVAGFVETRLWRWSWVPGVVLVGWLVWLVIPGYRAEVVGERLAWVIQLTFVTIASVGRRVLETE